MDGSARRFESGRVSLVQRDGIVAGLDLDADVPDQRFALMLAHAEDVVHTGENGGPLFTAVALFAMTAATAF
jgi:hypothetical protein